MRTRLIYSYLNITYREIKTRFLINILSRDVKQFVYTKRRKIYCKAIYNQLLIIIYFLHYMCFIQKSCNKDFVELIIICFQGFKGF